MNVADIFAQVELDLLNNMTKSIQSEDWKSNRLKAFKDFQRRNAALLSKYNISSEMEAALKDAYLKAGYATQNDIEKALKKGHSAVKSGTSFSVNDRKLQALINEINGDLRTAQTAMLRMTNDMYRNSIIKTQAAFASNLYTLDQCIDMATKDYLSAGINCIQYKNGAQVNIVTYAEMALRTGNRRATLQGEGAVRSDWGEYLVYISQYGACSDTCLPWQGRIYVDDVFSDGKARDDFPLLSEAVSSGLFHPNCRHTSSTWFEGLSKIPPIMDEDTVRSNSQLEEQQRYNERQIRKYKRLNEGSLDPANKAKYARKVTQWQSRQRELIKENPSVLRRDYSREQIRGAYGENKLDTAPKTKSNLESSSDWLQKYTTDHIKDFSKEQAVITDDSNNILLEIGGSGLDVDIPEDKKHLAKGAVVSHTHPTNMPFSAEDFAESNRLDVKEMHVITPNFIYSVERPVGGWGELNKTIRSSFQDELDNVQNQTMKAMMESLKKGQDIPENLPNTPDELWAEAYKNLFTAKGVKFKFVKYK